MESRLVTFETEVVAGAFKLGLTAAIVVAGIAAGVVLAATVLLG